MSNLKALRSMMNQYLSQTEIRGFCFDSNIEFEDLEGDGKRAQIISLLIKLKRENNLPILIDWLSEKRPDQQWSLYIDSEKDIQLSNTILQANKDKQLSQKSHQINNIQAQSSQINQFTGDNTQIHVTTNITHLNEVKKRKSKGSKSKKITDNIDLQHKSTEVLSSFTYFNILFFILIIAFIFSACFAYISLTRNPESINFLIGISTTVFLGVALVNSRKILFNWLEKQVKFWELDIKFRRQIRDQIVSDEAVSKFQRFIINRLLYVDTYEARRKLRGPLGK